MEFDSYVEHTAIVKKLNILMVAKNGGKQAALDVGVAVGDSQSHSFGARVSFQEYLKRTAQSGSSEALLQGVMVDLRAEYRGEHLGSAQHIYARFVESAGAGAGSHPQRFQVGSCRGSVLWTIVVTTSSPRSGATGSLSTSKSVREPNRWIP